MMKSTLPVAPDRRPETLAAVERLWILHPDWRLGQLLENVVAWTDQPVPEIEDDLLVEEIERHINESASRMEVAVEVVQE